MSGRTAEHIELIEAYAKEQGMWRHTGQDDPLYSDTLELDMGSVEPSIAGPKRPQDRIALGDADEVYRKHLETTIADRDTGGSASIEINGEAVDLVDGAVLIAAITSCTNTSNPAVMIAAGLALARNAREKGSQDKAMG